MTITAQSADGVQHQFPDGTDPAVIDRVMKDYAIGKSAPAVAATGNSGVFRITAPDGRVFNVTGPNAQGALAALQQHLGDNRSNVFDQFDAPNGSQGGNLFDQFDNPPRGMFDDLVPSKPPVSGTGMFDDLIPAKQPAPANWSDLLGNILPSAASAIGNTVGIIAHPFQTAQALNDTMAGAELNAENKMRKSLPSYLGWLANIPHAAASVNPLTATSMQLADASPAYAQQAQNAAGAVGGALADRYWGLDNLKRTAVNDPVGSLLDVATLAAGGEGLLGRVGLEGSRAADIAGTVARATNPVNVAGAAVSKAAPLLGKAASYPLSLLSGADPRAIQVAAQTGSEGGNAADLFRTAMRGGDTPDALVNDAKSALDAIAEQRRADYLNGIAPTASSTAVVDTAPIRQTVSDLRDSLYVKSQAAPGDNAASFAPLQKGSDADLKTLNTIDDLISQWEAHPQGRTPLGMDALKQRLNELQPSFADSGAANQRRLVTTVQDAIRNQIGAVEPSYGPAMANYAASKASSDAISRSLSLGPRASVDTALNKLMSSLRGDKVNRAANVAALEQHSPGLMARIAGQSLNDPIPKGNVAKAFSGLLGSTGYFNPAQLGLLPFTSPRFNAELAHVAGRASRRLGSLLGGDIPQQRMTQMLLGGQVFEPGMTQ